MFIIFIICSTNLLGQNTQNRTSHIVWKMKFYYRNDSISHYDFSSMKLSILYKYNQTPPRKEEEEEEEDEEESCY